jgi:ppGpp synthetase/RelA/SpoT-type nucleotidyltranferase
MAFAKPGFSKGQVNRAGEIFARPEAFSDDEQSWAGDVLANWRACHLYPINTFQATLRHRLKEVDCDAIVAQRLKRAPSIIAKLQRFEGMQLARMQDIGGLRAVVGTIAKVWKLESLYRQSARLKHELVSSKDYIGNPKDDGYRSVHLIYKYKNEHVPDYDGFSLELQIRTRLQHAWATAVETMGTFLGQALKSGQGEKQWRGFFTSASAALALVEKTSPVPGFQGRDSRSVFEEVSKLEQKLHVLHKLRGFAVAADKITAERGQGAFHLVILDSERRTVRILPYPLSRLDDANLAYSQIEKRTKAGEPIEAVLVSAGPIDALRKAYPNYFLDTQEFVRQIEKVIAAVAQKTR